MRNFEQEAHYAKHGVYSSELELKGNYYVTKDNVKDYLIKNPGHSTNVLFLKSLISEIKNSDNSKEELEKFFAEMSEIGYKFQIDEEGNQNSGKLTIECLEKVIKDNPDVIIFSEFIKNYYQELTKLGYLFENREKEFFLTDEELMQYLDIYPEIQNNQYYNTNYGEGPRYLRNSRKRIENSIKKKEKLNGKEPSNQHIGILEVTEKSLN